MTVEAKRVLEEKVNQVINEGDNDKIKSEINSVIQMIVKNEDRITLLEFMISAYRDEIIKLEEFNKVLEDKLFCLKLAL